MTKAKLFTSEVDLCAAFIAKLPAEWTAYAETAGWDILLVRKADGFQIGIEAKLAFNTLVLTQTLEEWWGGGAEHAGPDCRAVLIPADAGNGLGRIAAYIGVTVIRCEKIEKRFQRSFRPDLPSGNHRDTEWYEWAPAKRCKLPEYVPDVAAGASAPLQLTAWKIAAIKISVTLDKRGFVTRADFQKHGIDHRRFLARETGWLVKSDRRLSYLRGPHFPDFRAQHPRVYAEIEADSLKFLKADPAPKPAATQAVML